MKPLALAAFAFVASSLFARTSAAQTPAACDSCASCTDRLATPDAEVELTGDLVAQGPGPCIVVRGRHARLQGAGFTLRGAPGSIGVRVEADAVWLRNLTVRGGDVGIEVARARGVTLFRSTLAVTETALRVTQATDLRIVRAAIEGGRVGISFGADPAGTCTPTTLQSPGAVIEGSRIEGAGVAVAACDAIPVLRDDTLVGGSVGLRLGDVQPGTGPGGNGPWDACVCAPGLSGVGAGTALLFSSGCGGCMVHEGWLPSLRAQGADLRLRENATQADAQRRFDQHLEHCAPAVIDALGIPGCVPNYACPALGRVAKVRQGARELSMEVPLGSEGDVLAFARECAAAGRAARAGGRCLAESVTRTTICGQRDASVAVTGRGTRWRGHDNACGPNQGDASALGCTRPCPAPTAAPAPVPSLPAPAPSAPVLPPGGPIPPPAAPPPAAPAPAASAAPQSAPENNGPLWWIALAMAGGVGGWLVRGRRTRTQPPPP